MGWIHGQDDAEQIGQGVSEPGVGQLVANPATFGYRDDQSATAKTLQVVGQTLSRDVEPFGQVSRIARAYFECEHDP